MNNSLSMSKTLRLESITCIRGGKTLFADLCLAIEPGTILRIAGENGSGKSSLLRMMCGLLPAHSGQIFWGDDLIQEDRDQFHSDLVYLGHVPALKADLTAIENVVHLALLAGLSISTDEAFDALHQAGLANQAHRSIRTLSQGQKQRIALARLRLPNPKALWLLDEPFNALDQAANQALQSLLLEHVQRGGIVALSSHQSLAIDDGPHVMQLAL